jgi:hypothetical protein
MTGIPPTISEEKPKQHQTMPYPPKGVIKGTLAVGNMLQNGAFKVHSQLQRDDDHDCE